MSDRHGAVAVEIREISHTTYFAVFGIDRKENSGGLWSCPPQVSRVLPHTGPERVVVVRPTYPFHLFGLPQALHRHSPLAAPHFPRWVRLTPGDRPPGIYWRALVIAWWISTAVGSGC